MKLFLILLVNVKTLEPGIYRVIINVKLIFYNKDELDLTQILYDLELGEYMEEMQAIDYAQYRFDVH